MTFAGPVRKLVLAIHLTVSVGWLGAVVAYVALDVTVAASGEAQVVRGAWIAMAILTSWAIVPLAMTALATGVVIALGTAWGLFRHWWVLISLVLTVVAVLALLAEWPVIMHSAAIAHAPTTTPAEVLALRPTLAHSVGGLIVLAVIQWLNVFKPRGLTPYGWRRHQEEQARRP